MILTKNLKINPVLLTNIVFGFFPISFIFGNFIINMNFLLFCLLGIFNLRSKILKFKFTFPLKIIFLLFIVVFISTSFSFAQSLYFGTYEYNNLIRLFKSIVFFRFFLMLVIIYLLCEYNFLNFKYFFYSAAFASIFVSVDIIFINAS